MKHPLLKIFVPVYDGVVLSGLKYMGKFTPIEDIKTQKIQLISEDGRINYLIVGQTASSDNGYYSCFKEGVVHNKPHHFPKKWIDDNYIETDVNGRRVIDFRNIECNK